MSFPRSILLPVALCLLAAAAFQAAASQLLAQPPVAAPGSGPALIAKACEQAKHKQFCIDMLNSDKNSRGADLRGLAYIGLRLAERNATATSTFIKNAVTKTEGGSDAVAECSEHYLSAVDLIEDSISSLVSDKYGDVNNMAKAAIADLDTCDASLNEQEKVGTAAEVAKKNSQIRVLLNTALTVTRVAANSTMH